MELSIGDFFWHLGALLVYLGWAFKWVGGALMIGLIFCAAFYELGKGK